MLAKCGEFLLQKCQHDNKSSSYFLVINLPNSSKSNTDELQKRLKLLCTFLCVRSQLFCTSADIESIPLIIYVRNPQEFEFGFFSIYIISWGEAKPHESTFVDSPPPIHLRSTKIFNFLWNVWLNFFRVLYLTFENLQCKHSCCLCFATTLSVSSSIKLQPNPSKSEEHISALTNEQLI